MHLPAGHLEPSSTRTPALPRWRDPARNDARLTALVLSVSSCAWLATVAIHTAAEGNWHGPLARGEGALPDFAAFICGRPPSAGASFTAQLQWLVGWALMVLAMMLPPALPFLRAMSRATEHRTSAVATAAAVFVLLWAAVGLGLLGASSALARWIDAWPALAARPGLLGGLGAIAAGLYQFTPLKKACLTACRRPDGLILMAWNAASPHRAATRIGLHYAAVCVGCCWALMLLTLAVGAFALPLMVVVSIAMLLERSLPSVRAFVPLQAAFAVLIGALLITQNLTPSPALLLPAPLPLQGG